MTTPKTSASVPPEPVPTVQDRCHRGDYRNPLSFDDTPRDVYHRCEAELNDRFRRDLETQHRVQGWPLDLRTDLFSAAWGLGHGLGLLEVATYYDLLHNLTAGLRGWSRASGTPDHGRRDRGVGHPAGEPVTTGCTCQGLLIPTPDNTTDVCLMGRYHAPECALWDLERKAR